MLKRPAKQQTKANKQQCQFLWNELQQMPSNGAIASKDGKQYLRSK